jgi:hypothetical protein
VVVVWGRAGGGGSELISCSVREWGIWGGGVVGWMMRCYYVRSGTSRAVRACTACECQLRGQGTYLVQLRVVFVPFVKLLALLPTSGVATA